MPTNVLETLFVKTPTIFFFDILINLAVALVLGFGIALLYRKTYRGYSYSSAFVQTLILITMITAIVIMVIGNNLARAFGLVGAMSIIRFRTALKDSWDIAFIFFALAVGLAAGSGNHMIGLVGGLCISMVILILYRTHFGFLQTKELLLRFWMHPQQGGEPVYLPVFNKYLSQYSMLNVRSAPSGKFLELSFFVRLKKSDQSQNLIRDLSEIKGVDRVSLLVGEDMPEN
jgi:uncharacterized membrane protein YhiD involved in acid resistance